MWGARAASPSARLLTYLVLYAFPPDAHLAPAAPRRRARLPAPARVRRRLAPARAHADRAAAGGPRRARQGGADRRRRQRGPAARPRDAAQPRSSPTRRSASSTTTRARSGVRIHGVRVLGTTDELARILRDNRPDEVLIAMPSAPGEVRRKIVETSRGRGHPGQDAAGAARADLRRRQPRRPDPARCRSRTCSAASRSRSTSSAVAAYVRDRTVLVTGAGGSIGSELCRQLARLGVARLVLVDQGESALYEIERELVDERDFTGRDPGARRLRRRARRCARSSSATARRSSSTRPRTSTCRCSRRTRSQAVANNVLATRVMARGRGRVRRRALRPDLDRQGREPEEPARPVEGGLRVDRRVVRAARRRRDAVRRGALRQRARLVRLGDPDLPPPDRARRPGHGDRTRR